MKKSNYKINFVISILLLSVVISMYQGFKPLDPIVFEYPNSSAGEISVISPESKTYFEPDNGLYPGTYTFMNDDVDSNPDGFTVDEQGGQVNVKENIGEHNKVVELYDTSSAYEPELRNSFPAQLNGTVEFWMMSDDVTDATYFRLMDDQVASIYGTGIGRVCLDEDKFRYYDDLGWHDTTKIVYDDKWYHVKIEFECTPGNYRGLAQYTWRFYVDGEVFGDFGFQSNIHNISQAFFFTYWGDTNYRSYIDAIGYSWDPGYDIGDNIDEGLLLNYEAPTTLVWQGYSLDGNANKTITGNTTIPMPSDGSHYIQVFGNDTMGAMDDSDMRYFSVYPINIITPENKTYFEPMSGYYPGTYGFENEVAGDEGTELSFINRYDSDSSSAYIKAVDEMNGHKNVLQMYDGTSAANANFYGFRDFQTDIDFGTIEFWALNKEYTGDQMGICYNFGNETGMEYLSIYSLFIIRIDTDNDGLVNFNGNEWAGLYLDDTWHHIRIDFESTPGGYLGLDQYKLNFWFDQNKLLDNEPMLVNDSLGMICAHSHGYDNTRHDYLDALGFSWESDYSIGDNLNEGLLLSYENRTSLDWQGYSLDGGANNTILGNTTIQMPSFGPHDIQVFGNDTMGAMYESDISYFSVNPINLITPENITYTEPDSGYYPATYGFENDEIGTIPDDWEDFSETNCDAQIISEINGHNRIIELSDNNASSIAQIFQNFSGSHSTGEIEWWWSSDDVSKLSQFIIYATDATQAIVIQLDSNKFQYYDSTVLTDIAGVIPINNMWYHLKLIFDCSSDTFDLYIDGNLRLNNSNFRNIIDDFKWLRFKSIDSDSVYSQYIDALGYSWDADYSIGNNLYEGLFLSYENSTNLEWIGYSLDGQSNKTISGNTTIPFPTNGIYNIILSGNDTIGNYYSSDLRYFTISVSSPTISIINPLLTQYYGNSAPSFNVDIQGVNIDEIWYSLDSGITNITFVSFTRTVNQTEWDKFLHGTVTLTFYANDSFGHLGTNSVTFNKDLNAPTTSIHYTLYDLPNQILRSTPISFTANDNSESGVSTTQYKINDSAWIPYTGVFTLTGYDLGSCMITYQSIDAVGNIETEISVEFELVPIPPPPPDLSFIIYIIIGAAAVLFGFIYMKVIRPKTAPKREIKKKERAEQEKLERRFMEQQRTERKELEQKRLEQQRLEREKIVRAQEERQRVNQERIERERQAKEWDRQRKIELEKQRRLEEERVIIEKIRKALNVSTKLKMDILRGYLEMDEKQFYDKIFDWAEQFGFIIDGDYLNLKKENVSDFIEELEKQFKGWRKSEGEHLDKI